MLSKPVLITIVALELLSAIFAWRDLGRRTDNQIRGRRIFWRVVICLNPGNSLVYWAAGRKRAPASAA